MGSVSQPNLGYVSGGERRGPWREYAMSNYSRRTVLSASGMALTTPRVLSRTHPPTEGKIVFTYDDGYRVDYTKTFPVHRQEEAPACAAIPSGAIGRSRKYLSTDDIYQMIHEGWEVMSHGVKHEALGPVVLTRDVEPGDTRLYVEHTVLGRTPNEIEIHNGETRLAVVAITGKNPDEGYLELASPVDISIEARSGFVRFTEDVVRTVLENSRESLVDRGFDVTNFVLPYDRHDERTLSLIPNYYDAVANVFTGGINYPGRIDPYGLRRVYFREGWMSDTELEGYLDRVAEADALGILGGHSGESRLTTDRIRTAIREARARQLEVVTLQTVLDEFNLVERGGANPPSTTTPRTATTSPPRDATTSPPGTTAPPSPPPNPNCTPRASPVGVPSGGCERSSSPDRENNPLSSGLLRYFGAIVDFVRGVLGGFIPV